MQSSDSASQSNRVIGGHKAAMHNPNVSAEAKEHSRQVVEEIQASDVGKPIDTPKPSPHSYDDKDENRVLGGYKATLKNPNVSDEAKQKAEQILEERDAL